MCTLLSPDRPGLVKNALSKSKPYHVSPTLRLKSSAFGILKLFLFIYCFQLVCYYYLRYQTHIRLIDHFPSLLNSIKTFGMDRPVPAPMAQWLCHRLMGWWVLGSHIGTGSNPEQVFKGPMGRCKATTPSSLSLTTNHLS